jgi:hypothetical protein
MSNREFNEKRMEFVQAVTGAAQDWLAYMGTDAALAAIPRTEPPRYVVAGVLPEIVKLLPGADSIRDLLATTAGEQAEPAPSALKRERDRFERMFVAACEALGAINQALGLDPDDGGAEPILAAIEELKAQAAPAAPEQVSDAVKRAGAKMANTMFNLAQRAGDMIDGDLAAKFDEMRKEWDSAIRLAAPSAAQVQAQPTAYRRWNGEYFTYQNTLPPVRKAGWEPLYAAPSAAAPAAEEVQWISVAERLPEGACLASYQPHHRGHKPRVIRAIYFKQYQVEASGDGDQSTEYNEADDTEYIKAGWYERIDNWGDFSSVAVCEGEVTHWMPLPAAPASTEGGAA